MVDKGIRFVLWWYQMAGLPMWRSDFVCTNIYSHFISNGVFLNPSMLNIDVIYHLNMCARNKYQQTYMEHERDGK